MRNVSTMEEFSIRQIVQLYCLVIIAILSCLALGNFNTTLAPSWVQGIMSIFSYSCLLLLIFTTRYRFITKEIGLGVIALLSLFLLQNVNIAYGGVAKGGLFDFLILSLFFFVDDHVKVKALYVFRSFLICISAIGIICYF